jgi:MerR family transcriptional regulator, copper efflux regulator
VRIGQLADTTGVTASTLRFYERRGLLPPPQRTPAGHRTYASDATDRVAFIRRAQACGLTLTQIAEILAVRDDGHAPCHHLAGLVDVRLDDLERRIADLTRTRHELHQLRDRLDRLDPRDCTPDDICTAVPRPSR